MAKKSTKSGYLIRARKHSSASRNKDLTKSEREGHRRIASEYQKMANRKGR